MKINKNWTPKEFCTGIINPATGKEWILSDYYEDKKGNRYFTHDEALEIWKQIPGWGPCTDEFHKALAKLVWDEWADDWCEDVLGPVLNGFEYMRQKLGYELCGFRHRETGVLSSVGNRGASWSSTVTGPNANFLYFSYGGVNPNDNNNRGYGHQVRCLKEESTRKDIHRASRHIHKYCKECRTYLLRDWTSGKYDCRFADVCNKRKRYLALVNDCQAKAVEAFKQMCHFQDGRCRPNCEGCARLDQFTQKLNE